MSSHFRAWSYRQRNHKYKDIPAGISGYYAGLVEVNTLVQTACAYPDPLPEVKMGGAWTEEVVKKKMWSEYSNPRPTGRKR